MKNQMPAICEFKTVKAILGLQFLVLFYTVLICGRVGIQKLETATVNTPSSLLTPLTDANAPISPHPKIEIHAFLFARVNATRTLLSQLAASDYSPYPSTIRLVLHLDRPVRAKDRDPSTWAKNSEVEAMISRFEWPHGPKVLDIKPSHVGLKNSWITAWPHPGPNDIMIALEDDIEVSPLYFEWLAKILNEYDLWHANQRDPRLLGICMSPVTVDEITVHKKKKHRRWLPSENVPKEFRAYLHGIPCSWGAVYFGDQWSRFLSFYSIRGMPPFFDASYAAKSGDSNLWLPDSLSNKWTHSWKRFMFDFAYGRGAYLMYPNLNHNSGLARTLYLAGAHFKEDDPLYYPVPLALSSDDLDLGVSWPPYEALPLIDIHCKLVNRTSYAEQGAAFVTNITTRGQTYERLAQSWV